MTKVVAGAAIAVGECGEDDVTSANLEQIAAMSPASLMGPPRRQCDGTTFGVVSVGVLMIAERVVSGQGRR